MSPESDTEFTGVLCFIDILGFKEMEFTEASRKANKFRDILYRWVMRDSAALSVSELSIMPDAYTGNIQFSVISDAVFITLTPQTPAGVPLLTDVIRLIVALSFAMRDCILDEEPIPIRGSISFGMIETNPIQHMEGRHLVGKPVIDAVKFEEGQKWVGISLVPNDVWSENHELIRSLLSLGAIRKWAVPTSAGLQECYVITWPMESFREAFEAIREGGTNENNPRAKAKYVSTRVFMDHLSKWRENQS